MFRLIKRYAASTRLPGKQKNKCRKKVAESNYIDEINNISTTKNVQAKHKSITFEKLITRLFAATGERA